MKTYLNPLWPTKPLRWDGTSLFCDSMPVIGFHDLPMNGLGDSNEATVSGRALLRVLFFGSCIVAMIGIWKTPVVLIPLAVTGCSILYQRDHWRDHDRAWATIQDWLVNETDWLPHYVTKSTANHLPGHYAVILVNKVHQTLKVRSAVSMNREQCELLDYLNVRHQYEGPNLSHEIARDICWRRWPAIIDTVKGSP